MKIYFDADPPAYPAVDDLEPTPATAPARPARRQRAKPDDHAMTKRQFAAVWLIVGAIAAIDTLLAIAMLMLGVWWWWIPVALAVAFHAVWCVMAWRRFA